MDDVISSLTNVKKFYHKDNTNISGVTFDEFNNKFVVNMELDKWRFCTNDEKGILNEMEDIEKVTTKSDMAGLYSKIDEEIPSYDDSYEVESDDSSLEETDERKNFPDTFIWKTLFIRNSEEISFEDKVPDTMTTWVFTGFSLNKDHGFALAEPKELIAFQDFFIELSLPYSLNFGEILTIEPIVFNFVNTDYLDVEVKIYGEYKGKPQFEFYEQVDFSVSCKFVVKNTTVEVERLTVPQKTGSRSKWYIQALKTGEIKIHIEATATRTLGEKRIQRKDEIVKTLLIENQGVAHFMMKNYEYDDIKLKNHRSVDINTFDAVGIKEKTIDFSIVVAGDILGPMLPTHEDM